MKSYALVFCLLLTACSHLPPAIENAPLYDVSYQQAAQNITHYKDAPVRWGGVIVEVENEQNASLVQVLYYPLNGYGKPQTDETNPGRFVFKTEKFLDPAIYSKNSLVTVAGNLAGNIDCVIGKKNLSLPLINASTIYLWPPQIDNYYGQAGFGFGYYPYGYGAYPYYWRPYYRPFAPYPWW